MSCVRLKSAIQSIIACEAVGDLPECNPQLSPRAISRPRALDGNDIEIGILLGFLLQSDTC